MSTASTTADTKPGGATAKPGGRRKLLLVAAAVLLLAGGGGAGWLTGFIPGLLHKTEKAESHAAVEPKPAAPVFLDLPDIVANLNAGNRRTSFIKLKVKLELAKPEDQHAVQGAMPRILDLFQTYLREMRPEELRGTAGTYRLREELIARTNIAASPARVLNVLFTELLVQ